MAEAKELHIVMFPWLAFGHMLPFLELSKSLANKGHLISFISTQRNIQRLPPIPPNLAARINLVKLPLPSVDGLPEEAEATIDLPLEKVQYLKKAYDGLRAPFETLVSETSPDWIIYDCIPCWVPAISSKFGVPAIFFSVFTAATLAFLGPSMELKGGSRRRPEDFMVKPGWFPFNSTIAYRKDLAFPICENINIPDSSGMSSGQRIGLTIEGCDFVAVRSCREFEGKYVNLVNDLYKKPVIPVGLLPPSPVEERETGGAVEVHDNEWYKTFKWLDKQTPKSIMCVGFGSECRLSKDQVHELAFGIEISELPFIWALKKPLWAANDEDVLPQGFEDRTSERGVVCMGWAPQLKILAHPAIGGCLFHSGWGSIIECLHYGHALVLLPLMADQGLNARLLGEKGIGLEVETNEDDSFTRDAIAKSMRQVMVGAEGEPYRLKARQMRTIFADWDRQDEYIHWFLQYLNDHKQKGYHL